MKERKYSRTELGSLRRADLQNLFKVSRMLYPSDGCMETTNWLCLMTDGIVSIFHCSPPLYHPPLPHRYTD